MLVFAVVKAIAHTHLPLPSRGTFRFRYHLCEELQPLGEPERVRAAVPRASELQRGPAHASFCLPRYVQITKLGLQRGPAHAGFCLPRSVQITKSGPDRLTACQGKWE